MGWIQFFGAEWVALWSLGPLCPYASGKKAFVLSLLQASQPLKLPEAQHEALRFTSLCQAQSIHTPALTASGDRSKNRAFSPHFPYLLEYFSHNFFCLLKCLTITRVKKTLLKQNWYPSLLNFPLFKKEYHILSKTEQQPISL